MITIQWYSLIRNKYPIKPTKKSVRLLFQNFCIILLNNKTFCDAFSQIFDFSCSLVIPTSYIIHTISIIVKKIFCTFLFWTILSRCVKNSLLSIVKLLVWNKFLTATNTFDVLSSAIATDFCFNKKYFNYFLSCFFYGLFYLNNFYII